MADVAETRASLLMRVRDSRDDDAWTQFVEVYAPLIYGFARKKGLQEADAADITQDVFQAVARAIPQFDYDPQRGSFRGWLFVVTRNRIHKFLQGQPQGQGSGDSELAQRLLSHPAPLPEDDSSWDRDYERRLFTWAVNRIRPTVAESSWEAFWQTAVEGKSAKEVAGTLGLTVAAVYMAKSRLLARVKELIAQIQGESEHV